jgi:Subtilase family
MSQVTVNPGVGLSSASGSTQDLALIAQSPPSATPPLQQRLRALPNGDGDVAVRDSNGNTLATTLKARQVLRDGRWRSEGFVAERMSAYSATAPRHNVQPEPNGYGYFRAEHGKMRVITGRDGHVITDLPQARVRASEMMRNGGLSMTTDAEAQTAKEVMLRKPSPPTVTNTQVTQWKPVIPLPKAIEKMSPTDRAKYMVNEALRVAPASVKKELQGLLTPKNLALMVGLAAAQYVPGLNVVVDVAGILMLGKEATQAGIKIFGAIHSGLTTRQPYKLVQAGDQLAEAFTHLGVGSGAMLIGGVAARVAGKLGTKAAPVEGLSLPRASQLQGASNIVPFARPSRSKASRQPGGGAQNLGPPSGGTVVTANAPARAGAALAPAPGTGVRQRGSQASQAGLTPVPAVRPLPTVRAAAVLPLPAVPIQPEEMSEHKPLPEKRRGTGDGPIQVEPGVTRTPAEEKKFRAWLTRQGEPLRQQQLKEYREGRTTHEEVLHGRTGADRERMSAALDQIDRMRRGPSQGGGAGRSHTAAEVKEIWRRIDQRGGVQALPETTLREATGITAQALKDAQLKPAERNDLTKRLADARQAQTQYHKAREATKNNPPVDTSTWKLPMGGSVFGTQPDAKATGAALEPPSGSKAGSGATSSASKKTPAQRTVPRTLPLSTVTVASNAGAAPQPGRARPLPAAVEAVASELGLEVTYVQQLRDALGGTFGVRDAVNSLVNRRNLLLSANEATELVKAIRTAQSESTRGVKIAIEAALTREAPSGQSRAVFTNADWSKIEPLLIAQPALDNAAARQLRNLLKSGRVDPQSKEKITDYLKSVGDEFTVPAGGSTSTEPVPTSNLSTTDAGFAKLLIAAGRTKASVNVGVIDSFNTTAPGPSVRFNVKSELPGDSSSVDHGHGTMSLVGKAGRWVSIMNAAAGSSSLSSSIDRFAANGVRVINASLQLDLAADLSSLRTKAEDVRAAMARHPDVLFVYSAGNAGKDSMSLPFAASIGAGMPNVVYVGNVDAAGNLADSSIHGITVDIYAPGENRQVSQGRGKAYDVRSGTSYSAPEVTSVAAKMLVLCPTLKPAAVRDIIRQTASAPPVGAVGADGSVSGAGILNGDAATKVAALMTVAGRVGGLENAASVMKLSAADRSRLVPIAQRQLSLASTPERSATQGAGNLPVAQAGGSTKTLGLRVHRLSLGDARVNGHKVTDAQISRLAGGTDETLIDVSGSNGSMKIHAASRRADACLDLRFDASNGITIVKEPLLWRAAASNGGSAAKAETRALAVMATQAQALGLQSIYISVSPGSAGAAEWSGRGFSVLFEGVESLIHFDLKSGSNSWRQLTDTMKSQGIQAPPGFPAK